MDGRGSFEDLLEAYAAAWAVRIKHGDHSFAVLRTELDRPGLVGFGADGAGHDILARLWERGVRPEQLKSALRREFPGVALKALKAVGGAYLAIAKMFVGGTWEHEHLSWLEMPSGHRRLSDERKAFDLVLRHFHQPVVEIELGVTLDPTVLDGRPRVPSANRTDSYELPAWMRPSEESPRASVMVGELEVGETEVPATVWQDLTMEAANNVYADGSLFLPITGEGPTTIECVVPSTVPVCRALRRRPRSGSRAAASRPRGAGRGR